MISNVGSPQWSTAPTHHIWMNLSSRGTHMPCTRSVTKTALHKCWSYGAICFWCQLASWQHATYGIEILDIHRDHLDYLRYVTWIFPSPTSQRETISLFSVILESGGLEPSQFVDYHIQGTRLLAACHRMEMGCVASSTNLSFSNQVFVWIVWL